MTTRIVLTNGWTYDADDEREVLDMVKAVADVDDKDGSDPDLPKGWVWLGGLYVRSVDVIAVHDMPIVAPGRVAE